MAAALAPRRYIMLDDVMVTCDKPHIQTDFWFGEHTYDYDEVCDTD